MLTVKSMGKEFPITSKITDITNVIDESELSNLTPGFYKIRLHENFGRHELIVFVVSSYTMFDCIGLTITDIVGDAKDNLYWNGGWKVDDLGEPLEDWIKFHNCDPTVTSKLLGNSTWSILDDVKRYENVNCKS